MFNYQFRLSILLLVLPAIATAHEYYITDKVSIDVFELQFNQGEIVKSLPSGTAVTIEERSGEFSKIKTQDNITGWVASKYLTNEKPTQLEYLQLVARYNNAQDRIKDYENRLIELQDLRKEAKSVDWLRNEIKLGKNTSDRLENALHEKDAEIAGLNSTLNDMQIELDNARLQLNEVLESIRLQNGEQHPEPTDFGNSQGGFSDSLSIRNYTWLVLSLMVTLVIGILMGFVLIDHKIRRKHGDAPLY